MSKSLRSTNCSLPGFSVHGIFQARILEWVAISYSRGSFQPRDGNCVSCISCTGMHILYYWAIWDCLAAAAAKSLQSCLTLCDPIDGSPPGSSVHGIFQARVLERVAISFSQVSLTIYQSQNCFPVMNRWRWEVKKKGKVTLYCGIHLQDVGHVTLPECSIGLTCVLWLTSFRWLVSSQKMRQ